MPRYVRNQSLFDKFPGEVVLLIVKHLLDRQPQSDQTLQQYIKSTIGIQLLSWKMKLATDAVIGFHFYTFPTSVHHGVHDNRAPFHPSVYDPVQIHRIYWAFFQGKQAGRVPNFYALQRSLTIPRLPLLRCVSLDLRAHEPFTRSSLRLWKTMHAPRWVLSSTVLARMSIASYGIEELHLRITAQQDHIDLVEEIVAHNTNLRVIHIEVDSAVVNGRHIQPTIRLHKMFPHGRSHANIERFIIRAPSCHINCYIVGRDLRVNFFDHLRHTVEFVLVSSVFDAVSPTLDWLNRLLRHMSRIQHLDIAFDKPDSRSSSATQACFPPVHVRMLEKLSLQLPEVEGRFIRCIRAVSLYKIRVKTKVPIEQWLHCDDNHFPNLFIAHVQCPGPSAPRLIALGADEPFFYQNLDGFHNWTNSHPLAFLAYIKPYSRQHSHTEPTAPTSPVPVYEGSQHITGDEDSGPSTSQALVTTFTQAVVGLADDTPDATGSSAIAGPYRYLLPNGCVCPDPSR